LEHFQRVLPLIDPLYYTTPLKDNLVVQVGDDTDVIGHNAHALANFGLVLAGIKVDHALFITDIDDNRLDLHKATFTKV
jgi:hypothetical protein